VAMEPKDKLADLVAELRKAVIATELRRGRELRVASATAVRAAPGRR
jgi:hypothetical protein